jgi:alpha-1,3-rhamnosyl/mannosyltransferase
VNARGARRRPTVGVNLLWLVPDVVGGSEEYTVGLLTALAERPPAEYDVALFVLRPFVDAYPDVVSAFPTDVAPITGRHKGARVLAESTWLPVRAHRRGASVVHHAGGTMPVVRNCPGLVTIHDLQPLLRPDRFSRSKRAYLGRRVPPSVREAQLVLVLTRETGNAVIALGADPERVLVVPPGVDLALSGGPDVRAAYGIDGPFFLYPAITYEHKNHAFLVRAFASVAVRRPEAQLVFTGGAGEVEAEVAALIDELGLASRVLRLGRIPRGDLESLYQHAVALAFPSTFEGFGMPVLEAMAHGCPVVAAHTTAVPEVAGDAGWLLPPDDLEAWARALERLLDDAADRARLATTARDRAAEFTWAQTTDAIDGAYRRALAEVGALRGGAAEAVAGERAS